MSDCEKCGRDDGHWIGCVETAHSVDSIVHTTPATGRRHDTRESECIKNGCESPRAVSKGPTPAKYCTEHKTGSKK